MNRKSIFSALIILAVSFLLTGSTAPAQGGPGGGIRGPRPESVVNQLRDSLDLSKEQLARVTDIVSATFDSLAKAREQAQGDRQLMFEKVQELWKSMDANIEKELNDAQKIKYEAVKADREKRRQERMQQMRDRQGGGQ